MQVNLMKTRDTAKMPTRGSEEAAGADLYACFDEGVECVSILPNNTTLIPTGICMEIPDGYVGLVFPRSGLATKQGLTLANCVGVIDSDYRGEIGVALHNNSTEVREVHNYDRIAQIVIMPYMKPDFHEQETLCATTRGTGGFGSTGVQ